MLRAIVLGVLAAWLGAGCGEPADPRQREWIPDPDGPPGKTVASPTVPSPSATVVFYNTENLFDTRDDPGPGDDAFTTNGRMHWTEERYRRKLHQLAQAISMAGSELPVMIGLCEVENRSVVEDLAKTPPLDRGNYTVVHQDSPDERGIDVALLVDRDRATVKKEHGLPVDLGNDRTRDILHAVVDAPGRGRMDVFVNHWPSRREGSAESAPKRMRAATTLRAEVDRLLAGNKDARILIMGDLNDEPGDASVTVGLEAADPRQGRDAQLYDLMWADQLPPLGSISYDGVWQYFDHMIVSRGLMGPSTGKSKVQARSIKDERMIFHHPRYGDQPNRTFSGTKYHKDGYSDHLPVVLHLE